jgi:DNA-binding NarL/FixJ family response regulator
MLTTEHDLRANRQLAEAMSLRYERNMTLANLSRMQKVVARGLRTGMSTRDLCADIGISEQTFKAHITVINKKLGTFDRVQIVLTLQGVL